jgi:hypothetical protein
MRSSLAIALVLLTCSACSSEPTTRTPDGTLELFLRAMQASEEDPAIRAQAYRLLSREARRRLDARARLAGSLSNRHFEPWEMIAEGRYRLRFPPRRVDGFVTRMIGDDRAIVVVRGEREGERAEVGLVLEDGEWRVMLEVPELGRARAPAPDGGTQPPR